MPINSFLYPAKNVPVAYEVANSCRFNSGSTDHLDRTFGSAGNRRTFTVSFWLKTTTKQTYNAIFDAAQDGSNSDDMYFHTGRLNFSGYYGSTQFILRTTAKYRDPSAWYHFVVAFDTTQSTASNRIKIYANGVQETTFDDETYPSQNFQTSYMNLDRLHNIGTLVDSDNFPLDGYLAEFVFIDGQALDPTSFGEFDSDSPNIWKPIDVSGLTFGTNGFYLDFENASSLGADVSGNSNNFTARNLTSVDQSTDTCTNNFATLNSLVPSGGGFQSNSSVFSEGNLKFLTNNSSSNYGMCFSSIGVNSGKWYIEAKLDNKGGEDVFGISAQNITSTANYIGGGAYSWGFYQNGTYYHNNNGSAYDNNSWSTNDILRLALDLDNNKLYFGLNATWQNSGNPESGATGTGAVSITDPSSTDIGFYFFGYGNVSNSANGTISFNFGSPSFAISSGNADANGFGNFEYSVPSGYFSLCTKNLAEFG